MVLHSTEAKTEAHSSASQTLPGLNGKSFLFLTGPRSYKAADWIMRLSGSSSGPLGAAAAAFISFSASFYERGEEARPDGICHKMLLQYWQSAFLIMALSKREGWELFAVSDIVEIWHKMNLDNNVTSSLIFEPYQHTYCSFFFISTGHSESWASSCVSACRL